MRAWTMAMRQLRREWRAGELRALALAIVVAAAAMSAVTVFGERVEQALLRNANVLLAADLRVDGRQPLPPAWRDEAESRGLDTIELIEFPSVVLAGERNTLASVKAAETGYPLRGELLVAERAYGEPKPAQGLPAADEVWLASRLFNSLNVEVGDQVELGSKTLTVSAALIQEPDRGGGFGDLAPRLLVALPTAREAGLLGPGSRARYRLLFAGEAAAMERFDTWLTEAVAGTRYDIDRVMESQRRVASAIERAQSFLVLAALTAVLLAGIAVIIAANRFVSRHVDAVALLRSLGATRRQLLASYACMLSVLGVAAVIPGLIIGYASQYLLGSIIAALMPEPLGPPSFWPGLLSALLVLALLLGFVAPALWRLQNVSPMRVFNRAYLNEAGWGQRLSYLLPIVVFAALAWLLLGQTDLTIAVLIGLAGTALVMALVTAAFMWLIRRLVPDVGLAWRFGVANLFRHGSLSVVQVCAIGLGMTAVLMLGVVREQLFASWEDSLPEQTPNYFLLNIQPEQREALSQQLRDKLDMQSAPFYPMAVARLTAVNGVSAQDFVEANPQAAQRIDGNQNISWSRSLPPANRITAGDWWPESQATNEISVAERWAETTGIEVGDRLTFRVGASEAELLVSSIRRVDWDSFKVNFFLLLHPDVFVDAPRFYLTSLYVPPAQDALISDLVRAFPNVNVIDVGMLLTQVRKTIELVSNALNLVFVFTLLAGLVVLMAALQSTQDERRYESALLKALGLDRRRLLRGLNAEFLLIGALSGMVAALAASAMGWWLATSVFGLSYEWRFTFIGTSTIIGILVVWAASRFGVRRVLNTPPDRLLREGI